MTQYVLRAYCFGYNDENFYICGTRISDVFNDRTKAEEAYRKAQLGYLREVDLGEHEKFFNGEEAYIRRMDAFIYEKTGKHIIGEQGWVDLGTNIHTEMPDDDLFEFGETGELQAFKLISYDDEPVFYTLWNPDEESWFRVIDEGFEGLLYGASHDELMRMLNEHDVNLSWEEWEREGTLDALSDNPAVLRQLIDSTDEIEYDEAGQILRFSYPETDKALALNALLKDPLFEVRKLSLAEVQEVEKELDAFYDGGNAGITAGCAWSIVKFAAWILIPIAAITGLRCTFGTCDNYLDVFADTAGAAFKWVALIAIGTVLIFYGLIKLLGTRRRRKKAK